MAQHIHLVGFGSQGTAWAQCLRGSSWKVHVYLHRREGASFERASQLGFEPQMLSTLSESIANSASTDGAMIAMMLPDDQIASVYQEYLAAAPHALTLIVAHGYAVYARELTGLTKGHEVALLAPKAIGPKLLASWQAARPHAHELVAAFHSSPERAFGVRAVAKALGFAPENLVAATFEQEAVGDLISEQALLCGGVFSLLEWTMNAMRDAGVPDRLIREECLTELELIAGLLRQRGPAATFSAISQAAQCGTISMQQALLARGVDLAVAEQAQKVVSHEFVRFLRETDWKTRAAELKTRLAALEART